MSRVQTRVDAKNTMSETYASTELVLLDTIDANPR